MFTTKWTAIGRRLAVRGAVGRTTSDRRAGRHRQILAPLAATALAGAAVVAGVAASRAGRREASGRRAADGPAPAASPPPPCPPRHRGAGQAAKRAACVSPAADGRRLDAVVPAPRAHLGAPDAKTVHDVRKDLKRLRAELLLVEDHLGRRATAARTGYSPRSATRLSKARDAEVMLATLDGLIARHPRRLGRRGGVQRVRGGCSSARAGAHSRLEDPLVRAELLGDLLGFRERLAAWDVRAARPSCWSCLHRALYRDAADGGDGPSGAGAHARCMHVAPAGEALRYTSEALAA